nr:MAG: hypothetical protein AM324_03665 [Candidatus Thorarchaeota archaeon SMTZ1-83]
MHAVETVKPIVVRVVTRQRGETPVLAEAVLEAVSVTVSEAAILSCGDNSRGRIDLLRSISYLFWSIGVLTRYGIDYRTDR